MGNNFRHVFTFLLLAPIFIPWGGASAKAAQHSDANFAGYTSVSYCELVRYPNEYDGKAVAVHATYRYGFEWQELFCMKCRDRGKTWLEFEAETSPAVRRVLGKAPRNQGTVNAVFYGTFRSTKGPFGDGAYVFRLDVKSVKNVEIVSKDGWIPERLSVGEQQKLCRGDEANPSLTEKKHRLDIDDIE